MAPSGESKKMYQDLSLDELKAECTKRKLDISEAETADDYIKLLLISDMPDWGEIYGELLQIGLRYEEIAERTFPQIIAVRKGAASAMYAKMGLPFSPTLSSTEVPQEVDNDTRLAQVDQLLKAFNK